MGNKNRILKDHKRVGKQLIPPFLQDFNLQEISYVNIIIPETFWLAMLNKRCGNNAGASLSLDIVKVASELGGDNNLFSFASSFESLSINQKHSIKEKLLRGGHLGAIQSALQNFVNTYPLCPLNFLVDEIIEDQRDITEIKNLLEVLFDKRSKESTFMLANVIYHLFCLDRLKVTKDTSLAKLPEIEHYPNTEISKRIASNIRAAMYSIMHSPFYNASNKWNSYFWNRGIKLEPIKL